MELETISIGKVNKLPVPVVVIGSKLIGSRVAADFGVVPLSHTAGQVDVSNLDRTINLLRTFPKGTIVVNASGATNVNAIEAERDLRENSVAFKVNVLGNRNLAIASLRQGHYLVSFSSETAFGRGEKGRQILETDIPPKQMERTERSFYGTTKAWGEFEMLDYFVQGGNGLIIRIEYPSDKNAGYFPKVIGFPKLYFDVEITPTLIPELAAVIAQAYTLGITRQVLHAVGTPTSPYELGTKARAKLGIEGEIIRAAFVNEPNQAVRPQFSLLAKQNTELAIHYRLRTTDEQLNYLTS